MLNYQRVQPNQTKAGEFGSILGAVELSLCHEIARQCHQCGGTCCPSLKIHGRRQWTTTKICWSEWLGLWSEFPHENFPHVFATNHGQAGKNNCAVVTTCPTGAAERNRFRCSVNFRCVHRCPGTAGMGWDSCSTAHRRCPTTGMASHGILRKLPWFFQAIWAIHIHIISSYSSYHHIQNHHHCWFMLIYDDSWWFMFIHHIYVHH